jgi:hypothetical protein
MGYSQGMESQLGLVNGVQPCMSCLHFVKAVWDESCKYVIATRLPYYIHIVLIRFVFS